MAEPHSVSALRTKQSKIMDTIAMYEAKLLAAQHDLLHINSALRLFQITGANPGEVTPYVDMKRVFKRGETTAFCFEALKSGPMDTRELTRLLMEKKGFDTSDRVLWRAVALRVIHTLRVHAKRRRLDNTMRRKNVTLWRLAEPVACQSRTE